MGLLVGWFIFRLGKEASLKKLLFASTVILLFIAGENIELIAVKYPAFRDMRF